MRIVVDTMVVVSGIDVSTSPSSQIMQLWDQKSIEIASSETILTELQRVMQYPAIQRILPFTDAEIDRYVEKLRHGAYMVPGTTPVAVSPDPKDDMFFACAVEAEADYIVSKDKKHVLSVGSYQGIQTINPLAFVEEFLKRRRKAA